MAEGEWIEHDGKVMPVGGYVLVQIKCRWEVQHGDWTCRPSKAKKLRWNRAGDEGDILYYRIVKENDNA